MKKRYALITIIAVIFIGILFSYQEKINPVIENNKTISISSDTLSLNYETALDSGVYNTSTDTTYPTSGYILNTELSKCENGGTVTWDKKNKKLNIKGNISDKCYVYFDKATLADMCIGENMASCISENYTFDNSIYYHNGALANGANDNSYRYSGANPDNWICFGTDANTCDNEHLYRIIGVFDSVVIGSDGNPTGTTEKRVKLIKAYEGTETSLGTAPSGTAGRNTTYYKGNPDLTTSPGYKWKDAVPNNWTESALNTNILNGTYLTTIGTTWANKVAMSEWKIGSNNWANVAQRSQTMAYKNEVVNPVADGNGNKTTNAKIGLLYASDYGFATSDANWNVSLDSYHINSVKNNNWLFLGVNEWTISRQDETNYIAIIINNNGGLGGHGVVSTDIVRPSFYLNSSVILTGGTGTETNPYRIQ